RLRSPAGRPQRRRAEERAGTGILPPRRRREGARAHSPNRATRTAGETGSGRRCRRRSTRSAGIGGGESRAGPRELQQQSPRAVAKRVVSGGDNAVRAEPTRERCAVRDLVGDVADETNSHGDGGRPELPEVAQDRSPPTSRPVGSKVER